MNYIDILSRCSLFKGISRDDIEDMKSEGLLRYNHVSKEAVIFMTGEYINEIGIVLHGEVNIENIDLWGNRRILANIKEGDFFGETYALVNEPLMIDVVATCDSQIIYLSPSRIISGEFNGVQWGITMLTNMLTGAVEKNLTLSKKIFCTSPHSIRNRVFTFLSFQSVISGSKTFQIPFDRRQMADYLNLDRSALSKELSRMREEGLIDFYKNSFRIIDVSDSQPEQP